MKKLIEITPEWVIQNLSDAMYADGGGIMSVFAKCADDAWISLALSTLKIPFEECEYGDLDDLTICYEFKIEDIKYDCPSLYDFMKNLDKHNLGFKQNRAIGLN